ncbi:MAG: hypothetical protein IK050_05335, partial [Lachnospiraceae bacterium]|nr:hypothetical protein [Lachnospiraceae bacterium]
DAKKTNYLSLSILCLLLIGVLIAALYIMARRPYEDEVIQNVSLKALEKKYEPALKVKEECENVSALYEEVKKLAGLTDSNNDGLIAFLTELESKFPADASIEAFQSDNTMAVFTIKVPTMTEAAALIDTVRGFDSLFDVRVSSITRKTEDDESSIKHEKKVANPNFEEESVDGTFYLFNLECIYYANGATETKK